MPNKPNKPNKWIAALLGLFAQPLALMYVGQLRWAAVYFLVILAAGVLGVFFLHQTLVAAAISFAFIVACAVHAYHFARRYPDDRPRPAYSRWYGLLGAAAAWLLIVFGVRAFIAEPFIAPSGSMLPAIPLRAHLIVQKWGYGDYGTYGLSLIRSPISARLNRGDIIVFELPQDRSQHYVKRLVGLPGDTIEYRGKKLTINGEPVPRRQTTDYFAAQPRSYVPAFIETLPGAEYAVIVENNAPAHIAAPLAFPFRGQCAYDSRGVACTVPAGHYFTLGDNRDNSYDSRMWGFVPADHITGKVIYIVP